MMRKKNEDAINAPQTAPVIADLFDGRLLSKLPDDLVGNNIHAFTARVRDPLDMDSISNGAESPNVKRRYPAATNNSD